MADGQYAMKNCVSIGCDRASRALGLCLMHYKQKRRAKAKAARGQADFCLPSWSKDADLGYAAGYIDADGSITIAITKSVSTRHGIGFYPHVSAVSIDADSVMFLLNLFGGGKIVTRERNSGNLTSTFPVHQWYVGGERACWIAGVLAPYLKIKRQQAEALAAFYVGRLWSQSRKHNAMPEEEYQRRMKLVGLVKSRNRRDYLPKIGEIA